MSTLGEPLSIAELIDYVETHKRGTIDDEVLAALRRIPTTQRIHWYWRCGAWADGSRGRRRVWARA